MAKNYDFGGWASEYDVLCSDGKTILPGAFADQDGVDVPLVWGHDHSGPKTILGTAHIVHEDKGPYIFGSFNDSEDGQYAKAAVNHGDIRFLSIFADHLKKQATNPSNITKGTIKEVSLVPFGAANPGAYIDQAVIAHGDGTYGMSEDQAFISTGLAIDTDMDEVLSHADSEKENKPMADENKKDEKKDGKKERTVQDVLDEMTDEQKAVVDYLMEEAAKAAKGSSGKETDDDDDEDVEHSDDEGGNMKYNAFENAAPNRHDVLMHADQAAILAMAKDSRCGKFKTALKEYLEENDFIQHDDAGNVTVTAGGPVPVGGFDDTVRQVPTGYGDAMYTSFEAMLPEFKEFNGMNPPQQITPEWDWVDKVISKVHKSPMPRVRTSYIDLREFEEDLRAKGYQKGNYKKYTGQIKIARRTTSPQTIYVKNALHKDDIEDMDNFDYVNYLYQIDRQMYNVELATAILFGDGRQEDDEDKIHEEHIRPIWTDDDLYTIHYDMSKDKESIQGSNTSGYFGANFIAAEAMVTACLYSRETYKGTGTPDLFIEQRKLNEMLLSKDRNGRRIYSSINELKTALNVNNIYVCEKMKNRIRTDGDGNQWRLNALLVNLADYNLGATKGGQVTHITQFDIDFNQQKSLLEGRCSGALVRLYSAIAIEEPVTEEDPSQA